MILSVSVAISQETRVCTEPHVMNLGEIPEPLNASDSTVELVSGLDHKDVKGWGKDQ